jgi:hypothetical protein
VDTVAVLLQQIMVTYDAGLGHDVDYTCFSKKTMCKEIFGSGGQLIFIKRTEDSYRHVYADGIQVPRSPGTCTSTIGMLLLDSYGFLNRVRSLPAPLLVVVAYHQECQVTNRVENNWP